MMSRGLRSSCLLPVACALLALTACSGPNQDKPVLPSDSRAAPSETQVVVFAAASLRDAFAAMAEEFKCVHLGTEIVFNFAGTQELRTQLEHGAAADVFASADQRHVDELVAAGRLAGKVVFARNEPVVIASREAASAVRSIADLPRADRIVIGAEDVPIGRYTLQIFDHAASRLGADFRSRVEAKVASRELSVRQVLAKVRLGEADVGVVYRTDAATSEVTVVPIPADLNVIAEYPIAVVIGAAHPKLARAWVEYVRSPEGQAALTRAGFLLPEPTPNAATR